MTREWVKSLYPHAQKQCRDVGERPLTRPSQGSSAESRKVPKGPELHHCTSCPFYQTALLLLCHLWAGCSKARPLMALSICPQGSPLLINRDGCHGRKAWGQSPHSTFPQGKAMVPQTQPGRSRDGFLMHTDHLSALPRSRKEDARLLSSLKEFCWAGGWEREMKTRNKISWRKERRRKRLEKSWVQKAQRIRGGSGSLRQEPLLWWLILGAVWSGGSALTPSLISRARWLNTAPLSLMWTVRELGRICLGNKRKQRSCRV